MPPAGFEPATPASERPQTYALDYAAAGLVIVFLNLKFNFIFLPPTSRYSKIWRFNETLQPKLK